MGLPAAPRSVLWDGTPVRFSRCESCSRVGSSDQASIAELDRAGQNLSCLTQWSSTESRRPANLLPPCVTVLPRGRHTGCSLTKLQAQNFAEDVREISSCVWTCSKLKYINEMLTFSDFLSLWNSADYEWNKTGPDFRPSLKLHEAGENKAKLPFKHLIFIISLLLRKSPYCP